MTHRTLKSQKFGYKNDFSQNIYNYSVIGSAEHGVKQVDLKSIVVLIDIY